MSDEESVFPSWREFSVFSCEIGIDSSLLTDSFESVRLRSGSILVSILTSSVCVGHRSSRLIESWA